MCPRVDRLLSISSHDMGGVLSTTLRMFPLLNLELTGNRTYHHIRSQLGFGTPLEVAYDHVRESLHRTAARRKWLYDIKAGNRKFPVGYYPPAVQHKLGSPWIGPNQVVRQATGHTVCIQRDPAKPIIFVHMDDLKLCPGPKDVSWNPGVSTAKSLCASTVAFRPGSHVSDMTPAPSVDVSGWEDTGSHHSRSTTVNELDSPIDLTGHILSPFDIRNIDYQDSRFHSIAHLMCYPYAVAAEQKT